MLATVPREFTVAAACCIWPPSERRVRAIREAVGEGIDWDRFLRIVKRQRVVGLVHHGLAQAGVAAPPECSQQIQNTAERIARRNLRHAVESLRIQQVFDDAGIPILFVKGATLAQLAYGSLALKHSWDIDVLVPPATVPQALQLLASVGYRAFPPLPPLTDERFERWIRFAREYVLYNEDNSVRVEIHWRLADNTYFLPGISALSSTQTVALSGSMGLRTLVDDDLFAYLCVHGAIHGWSRLKWLADVAALMARDNASDAERRLQAARKTNSMDCVAQTFLLCDHVLGVPSVAAQAQELRRNYRHAWLQRIALNVMTNGDAETELGSAPFYRMPTLISHFMLGRGWNFVANEIWNGLNKPYDLQYVVLPKWLGFSYPLVRLFFWFKRRGRHRPLLAPSKSVQK